MTPFLPFALPDIGEDEVAEVVDSLRSGWLTTGPKTKKFEEDFSNFLGGGDIQAIAVNSATAGLHLALDAIGLEAGDEVITTDYTFTATAEVVRYFGADPIFIDIDPGSLNLNPKLIERAITKRTKAIIPVHFAGLSCDMALIHEIADRHGLKVIEDAAHSLPTTYDGRMIGALRSDVTVFSFYATKTIATGEGGMVVTRNPDLARRCRIMRLHGIDRDAFDRYTSTRPAWYYEVVAPGYKYNMTDLAASLGIHQLKKAHAFRVRREQMAARYNEAFKDLPIILPPKAAGSDIHAWHLYVIRLKDGRREERDRFIQEMADAGIGCSVHFIPCHMHPYWRDKYRLKSDSFPEAQGAFDTAVSLPIYTKMTVADQTRVIDAVRGLLAR